MGHETEKHWKHKDLDCVVIFTDMGHRCGYVGVQKPHVLFGLEYSKHSDKLGEALAVAKKGEIGKRGLIPLMCTDGETASPEIVFDVHGGLTFSGDGSDSYPIKTLKKRWWFGYDCAHSGDAKDLNEIKDTNMRETFSRFNDGVVRSLDYCIAECESLASQIAAIV